MACRIADNKPLDQLRDDLDLEARCHSSRGDCALSRERIESQTGIMGGPGAVIGYCQGLLERQDEPDEHTQFMIDELESIDAPWTYSHELFWEYNQGMSAEEYVSCAVKPLLGTGRVPILITSLDPAQEASTIQNILSSNPHVEQGETVLTRWTLGSQESAYVAADMINDLIDTAYQREEMPGWWPLLQTKDVNHLYTVQDALGDRFKYVNVAINPFTSTRIDKEFGENVTVAQFVLGHGDGVHSDGTVDVDADVDIGMQQQPRSYNVFAHAQRISELPYMPMTIICGPTLQNWSGAENRQRLSKFMDVFSEARKQMWNTVPEYRQDEILKLKA